MKIINPDNKASKETKLLNLLTLEIDLIMFRKDNSAMIFRELNITVPKEMIVLKIKIFRN